VCTNKSSMVSMSFENSPMVVLLSGVIRRTL
jgi:hypothetical protein